MTQTIALKFQAWLAAQTIACAHRLTRQGEINRANRLWKEFFAECRKQNVDPVEIHDAMFSTRHLN